MTEKIKNHNDQLIFTENVLLSGAEVTILSANSLRSYAEEVSVKLAKHKSTMIQYNPDQIYQAIIEGRSVIAYNLESSKLLGFGQVWQYKPNILEFGSWISYAQGIGKQIILAGTEVGNKLDPNAKTIAIVEESNNAPQHCITNIGGVFIGRKTSDRVFNRDSLQPAQMNIYDISLSSLINAKKGSDK